METAQDAWEIPGYQVQQKIGEGGTGQVFRATQLSLQRPVAIKILNPSLHGHSPLLAFNRESQLMASLAHPNIVAIHDCGQINGQFYLVMEHVAGRSLREEMIPGKPWSPSRAAPVISAIAQALACIHSRGILHLDLKPENVLCTSDGTVKVTDFGLAIPQVDAQNVFDLTWVQGSVDYCSPEQRHGLPQDQRSDVFALAVLAYEMLTGRVPGRFYVPATQRNPRLPASVDEVLQRGLARDPNERYATVDELGGDLCRILNPRRREMPAWAALVAAALVFSAGGYFLVHRPIKKTDPFISASVQRPTRGWLIFRNPENAWGFESEHEKIPLDVGGAPLTQVSLHNQPPGAKLDALVPDWPYPLPALVLAGPQWWCFFHPLEHASFAPEVIADWPKLFEIPPLASQENFIRAGHFEGDCLGGDNTIWRRGGWQTEKDVPVASIASPEDQPGTRALLLTKSAINANQEMVCYQWLAREPRRPRTIMILRYRARSEEGNASVAIGVVHPLLIPKSDKSELADRLRELKTADAPAPPVPDTDYAEYWVNDWVTPSPDWKTYCIVWPWPPYCANYSRNVVIHFGGEGKVWIDNVELFTWNREVTR
jgi:serine/threonine protein kinase